MSDPAPNLSANETPPARPNPPGAAVSHEPALKHRAAAWCAYVLGCSLAATLRYRWTDRSGYFENPTGKPAIYAVWHNRLLLCMKMYFGYVRKHNRTSGVALLISPSKDGAWSAAIHERFGAQSVRGSTNRRGGQALRELLRWARRGYDIGLTPDGPRGPRYVVQEGVMSLAQITGLPILPVSYKLNWKIRLKSWDQLLIPLPFARCEMIFEKPIFVPRDCTDDQREVLRQQLEQTLKAISAE